MDAASGECGGGLESPAMDNVDSLAIGRIVIGAASWAAPVTSFRLFKLHDGSQHHPYLARMFGAREIALGAATLIA